MDDLDTGDEQGKVAQVDGPRTEQGQSKSPETDGSGNWTLETMTGRQGRWVESLERSTRRQERNAELL